MTNVLPTMSDTDDSLEAWRRQRNRAYVFRDLMGQVESLHEGLWNRHHQFYQRGYQGDIRSSICDALSELWNACDSSLEQRIGVELLRFDYGSRANGMPRVRRGARFSDAFENGVTICPQMAFPFVHVDFGIALKAGDLRRIVAIECDGEEYHQDKARDRRRDEHVRDCGVEVIRFGSAEWSPAHVEEKLKVAIEGWWR